MATRGQADSQYVPMLREVRSRYISAEQPSASTLVGVSGPVVAAWLIEIETNAILPSERRRGRRMGRGRGPARAR